MNGRRWRRWHRVGDLASPWALLRRAYHVADAALFWLWWNGRSWTQDVVDLKRRIDAENEAFDAARRARQ